MYVFLCLELQENTEALKTKMSELRLYCDLLLEQVNKLKESPLGKGPTGSGEVSQYLSWVYDKTQVLIKLAGYLQISAKTYQST